MGPRIPEERKINAVREVEAGTRTARDICTELGIQGTQFKAWRVKFGTVKPNNGVSGISPAGSNGETTVSLSHATEQFQEMERLREQNAELKAENDDLRGMYMDLLLQHRKLVGLLEKKS